MAQAYPPYEIGASVFTHHLHVVRPAGSFAVQNVYPAVLLLTAFMWFALRQLSHILCFAALVSPSHRAACGCAPICQEQIGMAKPPLVAAMDGGHEYDYPVVLSLTTSMWFGLRPVP